MSAEDIMVLRGLASPRLWLLTVSFLIVIAPTSAFQETAVGNPQVAEEPAPEPQSAIVSYVPPPNSLPDFQGQPHSSYRSPALRHQRRRRNAYRRRRRRRLDNPRWYHPNADYIPEEEQTSWENYRRRPYRKRDAELPQQGSYRPYVLPLEPEPNAARFKNEDNRLDLQVEQGYGGGATYDDRRGSGGVGGAGGGYRRQRYQQQRRAAPRRHFRGWGSWQPDYEQPQQPPWSGRSSQYESGEARPKKEPARFFAREEADPAAVPEAPKLNYASEVAGQDGDVERVGDTLPAPEV